MHDRPDHKKSFADIRARGFLIQARHGVRGCEDQPTWWTGTYDDWDHPGHPLWTNCKPGAGWWASRQEADAALKQVMEVIGKLSIHADVSIVLEVVQRGRGNV